MAGSLVAARSAGRINLSVAPSTVRGDARTEMFHGFAPVVKKALPAVVNVSTSKLVKTGGGQNPFFSDPFFRQFFGQNSPFGSNVPQEQREHSLGSGVVISPDGYILTNNHVVDGATDVKVLFGDKREMKARIVGTDKKTDIAVLKVDATNLATLPIGDSSKMEPGDIVLAIGNPFGLNQTVTMGIVSAIGRGGLGIEDYEDFIQTDAAINPGNSGGALIDENGNLIGINTAILSGGGGGNEGVGFAIPINMARNVMDQILKYGKVTRAWLGVSIQPVTPEIAKAFNLQEDYGALVGDVEPDSPASRSGLQKGDIILDVNGEKIADSRALQLKIGMMKPDTEATLKVFRNGVTKDISVKLGEQKGNSSASNNNGESTDVMRGISVDNLSPDVLQQLRLPSDTKGVVITDVDPAGPGADAQLQRGDVIEEVNRKPVNSVSEFQSAMRAADNQPVLLLINRSGSTVFVVVNAK
jgi:serine protease Do